MLEVVLETALSSIKREQLLEAVDVCQFSRITLCFFPGGMSIP